MAEAYTFTNSLSNLFGNFLVEIRKRGTSFFYKYSLLLIIITDFTLKEFYFTFPGGIEREHWPEMG